MARKVIHTSPLFAVFAFVALLAAVLLLASHALSAQGAAADYAFRFPAGGKILLDPAVDKGRVWILADSRQVYTMRENGVVTGKGQTSIKNPTLIVPDGLGRALVSDGTGSAELLNQQGKAVWFVKLNGKLALPPFFDKHGFLYLCAGQSLVVYTPAGKTCEFLPLPEGQPLFAAPVRADGQDLLLLVFGETGGSARAMLLSEERELTREWKLPAHPSVVACSPAGFVASSGKTVWTARWQDTEARVLYEFSAPIIDLSLYEDSAASDSAEESVALLLGNRSLALLSGEKLAWQAQTKVSGSAKIKLSQDRVFVYNSALIQSFSREGELFRELSVSNSTTLLVPGCSGNVFSGGADWIVYVYRFEQQTEALPPTGKGTSEEELAAALEKELSWLSSGYTDASFISVLEETRLALGKLEPVPRRNKLMLLALAAAPDTSGIPDPGKNLSIPLRAEACALLGTLGDPEAVPFLVSVAVSETDETLVSAALDAIAAISIDPYGKALARLARDFKVSQSVETAYSLIRCVTTLVRSQGDTKNLEALALLSKLQDRRFPDAVRKKAQEALASLLR